MSPLSIRKATEADLPALLALYGQPSFNKGRVVTLDEARAIFARFAAYPDYATWLAFEDGRLAGSFTLMLVDNIAHWGTPTALIENVVIAEASQGRGLGSAMIRTALDLAEAGGAYKAALSSNLKGERAHAFYESLGFEKHGFSMRLGLPRSGAVARADAGESVPMEVRP